jgi:glycolate oxidase
VTLSVPNLPSPARPRVEAALRELERELGPSKLVTERDACASYAGDDSPALGRTPDVVVLAESRADVASALAIASRHGIPVTPRAAGTSRTGGAVCVAGGMVLSLTKLARVIEIDRREMIAVVEPGVVTGHLHGLVEAEGLFYPPDPSSAADCTIGGNAAANAGGPRAFKYGVTTDFVLGAEAITIGGSSLRVGRRTRKGVAGYDVTRLLVGSEGTLAVFTELTLRLVPKPAAVSTLLALFADVADAAAGVAAIVAAGAQPACLELLDRTTLDAVRADGVAIDPRAGAMLLVETDGEGAESERDRVGEALAALRGLVALQVAQDAAARSRLWAARKKMSRAVRKLAKYKLSEDVVVPRTRIAELLERSQVVARREGVRTLAYGHAGDGNLHVNFLWDDPEEAPRVDRAIEGLMRATIELGGTISGEHGIGLAKVPFLPLEQGAELIELQRRLKAVFDPAGLLNPGKIFAPGGHRDC